ncbi:hypothetical protein AAFF_G00035050 [Aldrovandia affinis]|uniref:C-type lectin domain-containing protein n=1 Tax=Aldrovandia affinis TaxID=143900 RepID=A0AAD7R229_9TELE|nr:hypothetical protein AAFF_G00035050 [Aldrovandia affinis]
MQSLTRSDRSPSASPALVIKIIDVFRVQDVTYLVFLDHDVYSTVDQTSHNSPELSLRDVYSTVRQTSPNSPGAQHTDQDVYSTVDQTSHNSPGAQHTDTSASQNYSVLEIRANKSNMSKDKDQLQRDFDAVVLKFRFLSKYCPIKSQKRVCKPCPEGWEQRNSKCYYFSTEEKSWMDSRRDCLKQRADLVIIESKEEQEFISKHTTGGYYYWIGLSDLETEGTWLWVDGTPLQEDKA